MCSINEQSLQEFQRIYKEVYGVEITAEEAGKQATQLLSLMRFALFPNNFDYGD